MKGMDPVVVANSDVMMSTMEDLSLISSLKGVSIYH